MSVGRAKELAIISLAALVAALPVLGGLSLAVLGLVTW